MRTCLFLDISFPTRPQAIAITELGGSPVRPHRDCVVQLAVLFEKVYW